MAASTKVVLNREALSRSRLAVADGVADLCERVLDTVRVPDAPPFGVGLIRKGGFTVLVDGRKIAGTAPKPRDMRVLRPGISGAVGFDFPARFQELGTVRQPARPFLTPVVRTASEGLAGMIRRRTALVR